MSKFNAHAAKPVVELYRDEPTLFFSPLALQKMQVYVEECKGEVGWLGAVDAYDNECYLCTDVHLLHQEVSGATTEITPEGLVKYAEEVGEEGAERCRLWGHSHVNMGVGPSGQDNSQMELFEKNGLEWFFRIICNKRGQIEVTFYNYKENYVVKDCAWQEYSEPVVDRETVVQEIAAKVKEKVYSYVGRGYTPPASQGYGYGSQWVGNERGLTNAWDDDEYLWGRSLAAAAEQKDEEDGKPEVKKNDGVGGAGEPSIKWGEQGSMDDDTYLALMDVLEEQLLAEVLELPYVCIRRLLDVAEGEESYASLPAAYTELVKKFNMDEEDLVEFAMDYQGDLLWQLEVLQYEEEHAHGLQ